MYIFVTIFLLRIPLGIYGRRTIEMEYVSAMLGFRTLGMLHPYSIGLEMALHIPPLYAWVTYPFLLMTQGFYVGRVAAAVFGLATLLMIYVIARRLEYSEREAGLAAFLLTVTPLFLNLSFGVMEDTLMMFLLSATFLAFLSYAETGEFRYLAATSVLASVAVLSNYQSIFVMIVPGTYLLKEYRLGIIRQVKESVVLALPVLAGLLWNHHIESLSEKSATSVLTKQTILQLPLDPIVLAKAFGPDLAAILPLIMLAPAVYVLEWEDHYLELLWFGALSLFLVVFLQRLMGNIQYWGIILPPAALLSGKVTGELLDRFAAYQRPLIVFILIAGILWASFFVSLRIPLQQEQVLAQEIQATGDQLADVYRKGDSVTVQRNIREVVFYSWIPVTTVKSTHLNITDGQVQDPGTDLIIMTDRERRLVSAVQRFKIKYLGKRFSVYGDTVQPPANYERVGGTEHVGIYRRTEDGTAAAGTGTLNGELSAVS